MSVHEDVVVSTFPHYAHHPYSGPPDRYLLRVAAAVDGEADDVAWLPEAPIVLRVYRAPDGRDELVRDVRRLLIATGHQQARSGGPWYLTTLEHLDALAERLGLLSVPVGAAPSGTHSGTGF